MDLLRSGTGRDPAVIETELVRLRDDCAALVRELEGRWERAVRVPRAIGMRTRRIERTVEEQARAHPGLTAAVFAIGVSVYAVRRYAASRAERDLRVRVAARGVKVLGARRVVSLLGALGGFLARWKMRKARWVMRRALRGPIERRRLLPERFEAAILERRTDWLY